MSIVAGVIEELINRDRVDLLLSTSGARFVLSAVYIGLFVLPLGWALAEFHRRSLCRSAYRTRNAIAIVLAGLPAGAAAGLLLAGALSATLRTEDYAVQVYVGLIIGLGIGVAFWKVHILSDTVLSAAVRIGNEPGLG